MGILCILGQRVTGSLLNILWGERVKSRVSLFTSFTHVAWYVTIAVPVIGGEQQLHPLEAMSLNMVMRRIVYPTLQLLLCTNPWSMPAALKTPVCTILKALIEVNTHTHTHKAFGRDWYNTQSVLQVSAQMAHFGTT